MTRLQILIVSLAAVLFFGIYFGFSTQSLSQKEFSQSKNLEGIDVNMEEFISHSKERLGMEVLNSIEWEEDFVNSSGDSTDKLEGLKELSGLWFRAGNKPIAGYYAYAAADIGNSESSWSIAGTTFASALTDNYEPYVLQFCKQQAVRAFENAISINPDKLQHRINLAVTHAELPSQENPMRGVLMLQELEEQFPQEARVPLAIARLAIKTGQNERAEDRLEQAYALDSADPDIVCLLAHVYFENGDSRAETLSLKCDSLKINN